MGKFNFGIDASSASDADLNEGYYTGDCPPKGNYRCVVKQVKINLNSSGDHRISVLNEITEPEGSDKAQYNGAAAWTGLNITEQGKPWVNNWLDAIGAKRSDFWAEKIVCSPGKIDRETKQDVLKIGSRKTTGHEVVVSCKISNYNGNDSLDVQRYLDHEPSSSVGSSDAVEPDDYAGGLEDPATEETNDNAGSDAEGGEGYTEAELDELDKPDLQGICKEWGIEFAPKATIATLVKAILKAQDDDGTEAEAAEPEADATDDEDPLTEEDLEEMSKAELVGYMEGKSWDVPSPAIPSRLRKAILQFQAAPPF